MVSFVNSNMRQSALLYLAERGNIRAIFLLDHRDFSMYRLKGGRNLKIIPERP
jgi:hypothetical protein